MNKMELLVDFHKDGPRQGPGSEEATVQALSLLPFPGGEALQIADIGCGTGAQTLTLARHTRGQVTAVDLFPEFTEALADHAEAAGLQGRIRTLNASMDALPFSDQQFDLIWSEGAIYIMGFENGLNAWRPFLKPHGCLAVSELTWTSAARPAEPAAFWEKEYPEMGSIGGKIKTCEQCGYQALAHFILPASCWMDNYYKPMEDRFDAFLKRHSHSAAATAQVENDRNEIAMYRKYGQYYGYVFYILQRIDR